MHLLRVCGRQKSNDSRILQVQFGLFPICWEGGWDWTKLLVVRTIYLTNILISSPTSILISSPYSLPTSFPHRYLAHGPTAARSPPPSHWAAAAVALL